MGQAQDVDWNPEPMLTPPEIGQRRDDYLHRLGIQKDARAGFAISRPSAVAEAPFRLQSADNPATSSQKVGASANEDGCFEMNILNVNLQSHDDFRVAYLRKLSYRKVWTPSVARPPKHQTVCIFDWDDTLLPTSYVGFREEEAISEVAKQHLKGIQREGKRLLKMAQRAGHTFIITNALPCWVEYSARRYLPGLVEALQSIPVISARGQYEEQFPGEHAQWKVQAFLQVQRQLDSEVVTNLISVGDSTFEMDAVHVMGREFEQAVVKTVKFRENPTAEELHKELELVATKFEQILSKAQNLKITLERISRGRQKERAPEQDKGTLPGSNDPPP